MDHNIHFEDIVKVMKEYGYEIKQPKGGSSRCSFVKPGCMTCSDSLDDLLELAKDAKRNMEFRKMGKRFRFLVIYNRIQDNLN